jgi:hypothetical protein
MSGAVAVDGTHGSRPGRQAVAMSQRGAEPRPEPDAGLPGRVNREMRRFVSATQGRRVVPRRVHVGVPDGERVSVPDLPWYDAALRADLLGSAVAGVASPGVLCLWITRTGLPEPRDADLPWTAAATQAFGRYGVGIAGLFVVTRTGWADLRTGVVHRWARVRQSQV